jgi:alpha-tubulin suppressor-like RCC1 family protein
MQGCLAAPSLRSCWRSGAGEPACAAVLSIRAGTDHTCAITTDQRLWCWGLDTHGQLGVGDGAASSSPAAVTGPPETWLDVAPEWLSTCGVGSDGTLWCWGEGVRRPARIGDVADWREVEGTLQHRCALRRAGGWSCWGMNGFGQLALGDTVDRAAPTAVDGEITALDHGEFHACGFIGPSLHCWGQNQFGKLGTGIADLTPHPNPERVLTDSVFSVVSAGASHTCALAPDGAAYCWGQNHESALGVGIPTVEVTTPRAVVGGHRFAILSAARRFTCAITEAGRLWCWGINDVGQLGLGDTMLRTEPTAVMEPPGEWTAVDGGGRHTCGLIGQQAFCWGINDRGQLGTGDTETRLAPARVCIPAS